jgi:hypothetical protein
MRFIGVFLKIFRLQQFSFFLKGFRTFFIFLLCFYLKKIKKAKIGRFFLILNCIFKNHIFKSHLKIVIFKSLF